ncbi:hypothetical protein SDC9_61940 [bioreactor metagenome]|uniref:Uncharacterized protein n=1 Tax=bioreactor metagenome TaxID=1076179 RepID=A0A644XHJ9_9ZZZZ
MIWFYRSSEKVRERALTDRDFWFMIKMEESMGSPSRFGTLLSHYADKVFDQAKGTEALQKIKSWHTICYNYNKVDA